MRSIYSNRTLKLLAEPGNGFTGTERVKTDAELTAANGGQTVIGRNVTVAVLDTGLDGTHGDLSGRVVRNASTVGVAGLGVSFNYPITVEGLPNTDPVSGHGTFVGGVIAGNGARSSGRYTGVAPGAKLVGVSTGVLDLLSVIEGFDYILWKRQELGIKVVNCSFSADTLLRPERSGQRRHQDAHRPWRQRGLLGGQQRPGHGHAQSLRDGAVGDQRRRYG